MSSVEGTYALYSFLTTIPLHQGAEKTVSRF